MLSQKKEDMIGNRKETNSTKNTHTCFVQNNDIEFLSKKRLKFLKINYRMKFDKR